MPLTCPRLASAMTEPDATKPLDRRPQSGERKASARSRDSHATRQACGRDERPKPATHESEVRRSRAAAVQVPPRRPPASGNGQQWPRTDSGATPHHCRAGESAVAPPDTRRPSPSPASADRTRTSPRYAGRSEPAWHQDGPARRSRYRVDAQASRTQERVEALSTRPSTGHRHVDAAQPLLAGSPVVAQRRLHRPKQMNVQSSHAHRRLSALRTRHCTLSSPLRLLLHPHK